MIAPEDKGEDSSEAKHEQDVVREAGEVAHVKARQVDATLWSK